MARGVREALAALPWDNCRQSGCTADKVEVERAWKLMNFFTQPFFVSERYTQQPGSHVSLTEALRGCREIMQGQHDDMPVQAFYFGGSIDRFLIAHGTAGPVASCHRTAQKQGGRAHIKNLLAYSRASRRPETIFLTVSIFVDIVGNFVCCGFLDICTIRVSGGLHRIPPGLVGTDRADVALLASA